MAPFRVPKPVRPSRWQVVFPCFPCTAPSFQLLSIVFLLLLLFAPISNPDDSANLKNDAYPQFDQKHLGQKQAKVGLILPFSTFNQRKYVAEIHSAVEPFKESPHPLFKFTAREVEMITITLNPTPTKILHILCDRFLPKNVSAIIYITRNEGYGRNTASSQYFLQLAGYLGIPVIAWNADNSGLEQASQSGLLLQMAPSIHHQARAMLSILVRYQWHAFTIVTSHIAGHTDFVQTIREAVLSFEDPNDHSSPNFKFAIIDTILVENYKEDLKSIKNTEARIMLLYSTKEEAGYIMQEAESLNLTGQNYVWIVTQSVIGKDMTVKSVFPVGMLGVHFLTDDAAGFAEIVKALRIYGYGVRDFYNDPRNLDTDLRPRVSCDGTFPSQWLGGKNFYRYLKNISVSYESIVVEKEAKRGASERPLVRFNKDGTRADVELHIMNLRKEAGSLNVHKWEEIGTWWSWEKEGLTINDIVWPGNQHVPPPGVPEKFNLKIVFLDEPPYISLSNLDPVTNECNANGGVKCKLGPDPRIGPNGTASNSTNDMCCSGFCIDLLKKFSEDLGFQYELFRVEDGKWGTIVGNKWNGLVAALMNRKADMALSSFKINSERESVVDFTVPFLESGISIVVSKRTGIISPTAFLEPFDIASWMLVAFVAIQVAALTIFLFEWLSPDGYNMKIAPPRNHKFSLFRTYWLVWAVLFQAAVHVDCPKGFTARFMANIWAMFAVVFLAIYTANLAAFMITREEYHDFSGLDDKRLQNPYVRKPPFKYATVPYTNADSVLAKHQEKMYSYMKSYNRTTMAEGILSIKKGELDAFIYDATVLDYAVKQDEECMLLTVGSWYAMTGYGLAFQRGSKYTASFNKRLMSYKDNGDIERLQRFWLTGACKPKKSSKRASEPLALEQFLSAYLLLFSGVVMALMLLVLEHVYFSYLRKLLVKRDRGGCCALISLSMGKSLSFRGAVFEAQDKLRMHRCRDPLCDSHIWKMKRDLDVATIKIKQLEKELESNGINPSKKYSTPKQRSLCGGCWKPPKPEDEEDPPLPQILNVYASLSSSSQIDCDSYKARELYGGIRDMTRNHVTSNEPTRTLHVEGLVSCEPPATPSVSTDTDDYSQCLRKRSSTLDMREIAEMETVL